jgi:diadenosine tetraphosphate (Ap4A) HIT family hydrolase
MNGRDDWATRVSASPAPSALRGRPRTKTGTSWPLCRRRRSIWRRTRPIAASVKLIFDRRHAARFDQLTAAEYEAFAGDLFGAQNAVVRTLRPDHVNIESLGNVVPHLHWHIVPRYVGDARWGMPIWTTPLDVMPDHRLDPADREQLVATIRGAL